MGIMDLSINQEEMGVQNRFGNQLYKLNRFDETDVKGNNNLYNSRKTDTENDSGFLFRDSYSSENLQVDPSLFSYSSFKKAMDLRTHTRTDNENRRTIFDDADYFAKNFFYKLLPITFEQVDETIIHIEHNYSLFSLNSESEPEEDCSRTMDYSQIKEKNYKRRRTKFREGSSDDVWDGNEDLVNPYEETPNEREPFAPSLESEPENAIQPLDLSTAPPVQEQKTDNHRHCSPAVREENLPSKLKGIQVTITRPDEKENYQPCEMFLNDIARLVPRLIKNDCFEIDILDRTGDRQDDFRRHRLYYIIAESTWRLFQSTRERVILTNDHTLGPPVKKTEKDERPTFLVFDQFSLAKCLAEYCDEIGGCFEYTRVEVGKELENEGDVRNTKMIELVTKSIEINTNNQRMIEINAEEVKTIETDTKEIQMDELNTELENAIAEEITMEAKNCKMDNEGTTLDMIEIISEKPKQESDLTETKNEKLENGAKTEEKNEETERVELEINENEVNAMERKQEDQKKLNAEDLPLNLHEIKAKANKKQQKKRKRANKNAEKKEKGTVNAKNVKSKKISTREVEAGKVEKEKQETVVSDNETKLTATVAGYSKSDNINTKETIEIKNNKEEVKECERTKTEAIESSLENHIVDDSGKTKLDETKRKGSKVFVGKTKSDEKKVEKVTKTQPQKRVIEMKETRKSKKARKVIQTVGKETRASVVNAKETKMDEHGKKEITERKAGEGKENVSKQTTKIERRQMSIKGSVMNKSDTKISKKKSESIEQGKKLERLEVKSKRRRSVVIEPENLPSINTRKRVKSENNPSVPIPKIKTRSQSTSESDSSQKPNKEIQKPKSATKKPEMGILRTKESGERSMRLEKGADGRKQGLKVKANVRGTKRKLKEEKVEERCLRSRGEKEKIEKMDASNKRKKR